MKMKKMKAAMAAMAMIALTFTACSGDDGADGPAGATGNANVSSNTYTVLAADWNQGAASNYNAGITQNVVNSGTVQAFFSGVGISDSTVWSPLPSGNFSFAYETDTVTFLTPGFTGASFTTYYKVVSIPSSAKVDGVDGTDFEELKMVYGFED